MIDLFRTSWKMQKEGEKGGRKNLMNQEVQKRYDLAAIEILTIIIK